MLAVVIPAYNRADRLEKALHNLEGQTFQRFLTIVVDDCSDEDLKSVCDKSSLNITYVRQESNKGPAAARQRGLDMCIAGRIELVTFMDSDDLYMPHALNTLVYEINHSNKDMVASGISWEEPHGPNSTILPPKNITWMGGKIYRVSALVKHNINFNETLRTNEDLDFNLKVKFSKMDNAFIEDIMYFGCHDERSIVHKESEDKNNCEGIDYIRAIYSVYKWLIEHDLSIKGNIYNIMACYGYYELHTELYGAPPQEIDDKLTEMLSSQEVENLLKKCYYWYRINNKGYTVRDDEVILFKETLYDWLKNHGYERS